MRNLEPMVHAAYGGGEDNLRLCKELGFTVFQTDSDHLLKQRAVRNNVISDKPQSGQCPL